MAKKVNRKIAVMGLGYVGLPIAVAFGKKYKIVGFDKNAKRIDELKHHIDKNLDCSKEELKSAKILYTHRIKDLKNSNFFIIAVPTPITSTNQPDFSYLVSVSREVGKVLKKGDIVVYESTVYPGATEEICLPVLEKTSKLVGRKDFKIGYSPERINPGDPKHKFTNIIKIVSGQDEETLNIIANVYESVVKAGVYRASSIKVAEAAKVIENTQRDLNVSLINEISLILHRIGIDTLEVLEAAATKWNFLPFRPGLVGGHCIGVDPYYLTYKAIELGYHPDVILAGRRINDLMGKFIAEQTIKKLIQLGYHIKRARIAVLGFTFKENCPDVRNTRIFDLVEELKSYDTEVLVHDPVADVNEVKTEYGVNLTPWDALSDIDAIVLAVSHDEYLKLDANFFKEKLNNKGLIMDVKSVLNRDDFKGCGITLWRL